MSNQVQVLVVPVDQNPYLKTIDNTLENMQEIVGGYLELISLDNGLNLFLNEEGKLLGLKPNIQMMHLNDIIVGQFFVCLDEGEDVASITKEQAQYFLDRYVVGTKINPVLNMLVNSKLK